MDAETPMPATDMTPEQKAVAATELDSAWPQIEAEADRIPQEQRDLEAQIDEIDRILFPDVTPYKEDE